MILMGSGVFDGRILAREVLAMVEVKIGYRTVDLPYTIRLYGVTEEEFDELVDDEGTKAELLDGVMVVHSPATIRHDDLGGFLRFLMRGYADERQLGIVLGPDSLVHLATCRRFAPDLFFVDHSRVLLPMPKQFEGAPDQIVEVLSPSNREYDLEDKRPAYQEARVGEIWFVDSARREVIVDRRRGKRYLTSMISKGRVSSGILSGFWLETAWLWSEPLPNGMACLREILGGS